jgi:protein O-GlcNAc transferase
MFSILDILSLSSPIRILDLGAAWFPGDPRSYDTLLERTKCEVIGFDARSEACEKLDAIYGGKPDFTFLPYAIGDGSPQTLYICSLKSCSSLYPPNLELCGKFTAYADYMEVVDQYQVMTHRLDDILEIGDVDWAKMDIQGAELDAIRGGTETLRKAMVVETEVKFIEQYVGQPLFAEVDQELRRLGFMFHTFLGYGTRPLKPVILQSDPRKGFRQWLWADAVYVPELSSMKNLSPERLLKLACILHEAYKSFDLACYALIHYDSLLGTNLADQYLQQLKIMASP